MIECERVYTAPERAEESHGRLPEESGEKVRPNHEQVMARPTFHRGDEDPRMMMPDPSIVFPVSDPATSFHEGRASPDADPVVHMPPPLRPAIALAPLPLTAQRLVERPLGLQVPLEVRVDPHSWLIGRCPSETPIQNLGRSARPGKPNRLLCLLALVAPGCDESPMKSPIYPPEAVQPSRSGSVWPCVNRVSLFQGKQLSAPSVSRRWAGRKSDDLTVARPPGPSTKLYFEVEYTGVNKR